MRLNETAVAEIRSTEGVYRPIDVARHYGVHPSTVRRIWDNEMHTGIPAAPEPPNVRTRPRPSELAEDIRLLLTRGMTPAAVAKEVGVSVASVYAIGKGVFV